MAGGFAPLPEIALPDPIPEPEIPANKYPNTDAEDRKATGQDWQ
jgi:hypothetical protein